MGNSLSKMVLLFFSIIIGAGMIAFSLLSKINLVKNKAEVKIAGQIIIADVAKTDAEREKGLGGRSELGVNEGMLFVFPEDDVYAFWMKDMEFPIDVIWIRNGRIVGFSENVAPGKDGDPADTVFSPPEPIDRALELRAGRVKLLKASAGDEVKSRPLVGTE